MKNSVKGNFDNINEKIIENLKGGCSMSIFGSYGAINRFFRSNFKPNSFNRLANPIKPARVPLTDSKISSTISMGNAPPRLDDRSGVVVKYLEKTVVDPLAKAADELLDKTEPTLKDHKNIVLLVESWKEHILTVTVGDIGATVGKQALELAILAHCPSLKPAKDVYDLAAFIGTLQDSNNSTLPRLDLLKTFLNEFSSQVAKIDTCNAIKKEDVIELLDRSRDNYLKGYNLNMDKMEECSLKIDKNYNNESKPLLSGDDD